MNELLDRELNYHQIIGLGAIIGDETEEVFFGRVGGANLAIINAWKCNKPTSLKVSFNSTELEIPIEPIPEKLARCWSFWTYSQGPLSEEHQVIIDHLKKINAENTKEVFEATYIAIEKVMDPRTIAERSENGFIYEVIPNQEKGNILIFTGPEIKKVAFEKGTAITYKS